jgi:hypothetical protein
VGHDFSALAGVKTGKIVVATLTVPDGDLGSPGRHVRIDWGDSTKPSEGTLVANSDGTFSVVGHHKYATVGTYTVQVTISGQNAPSLSAVCTATVTASVPVVAATATQDHSAHHVQLSVAYADAARVGHFLKINWGDGTENTIDLGAQRYGLVRVTHDYARNGQDSAMITVAVVDADGTSSVPVTLTVRLRHVPRDARLQQSACWDAFYAAVADQLAAYLSKVSD